MNVTFLCSTPEDGFYGTKVNRQWNGVLGDLDGYFFPNNGLCLFLILFYLSQTLVLV